METQKRAQRLQKTDFRCPGGGTLSPDSAKLIGRRTPEMEHGAEMTPNLRSCAFLAACSVVLVGVGGEVCANPSKEQLARWLKQFPKADANGDGVLTIGEAKAYRAEVQGGDGQDGSQPRRGAARSFPVNPGWEKEKFPDHAVCYQSPERIREIYAKGLDSGRNPVTSFPRPKDGGLRIVGTGHSFMGPGYKTLPKICRAAGFQQPLHLHTGGGMTGSARFKWEQENGIFQFEGKPKPKLLASIANAEWEAMMWGPYFNDRPEYYLCWMEFCLKYNPAMKFYLSDAWPQIEHLDRIPDSGKGFVAETITSLGKLKNAAYGEILSVLNRKYPGRVFVLPTSDAMVLASQYFERGELPGVEGLHRALGGKKRSLWRDKLGHLGPGFEWLEGYVFYATLYRRSPELIKKEIDLGDFPGAKLDRIFRRIAWEAVTGNPFSGVRDENRDGVADES